MKMFDEQQVHLNHRVSQEYVSRGVWRKNMHVVSNGSCAVAV